MEARIKIQDINSSYLEELSDDSLLQVILGGGQPTTGTSLGYDIGYALGWAADKVRDGWNWLTQ